MSEWLKAHAWKAIVATLIEPHRNTSSHNQFNDLARCGDDVTRKRRLFVDGLDPTLHSSYTKSAFQLKRLHFETHADVARPAIKGGQSGGVQASEADPDSASVV